MRRFLLALLAISLLSGCGGADVSLFATAVQTTRDAGGAEVAYQWNYEVPGSDETVVMLGSGFEDASRERAQSKAQLPGGGELEAIGDNWDLYMRGDVFVDELGGKEWIKLDLRRAYEGLGIDLSALGQVGQGTSTQLDALEQVSGGVSDEGRDVVRGVDTTHYSATIDLNNVAGDSADRLIDLVGDSQIEMDVWIDDDKRIRRVEWEQTLPDADGTTMTMIMEYVRFGVPGTIDIPDEADVFDATDVTIQTLQQELH